MTTAEEVRTLLKAECEAAGSMRKWAKAHGITETQVQFACNGRFPPQPKILAALGLERVVTYRKKEAQ